MQAIAAMRIESMIIADTMRRYDVRALPHAANSYQTARSNVYVLTLHPQQKIKDVLRLEDELNESLSRERGAQLAIRFLFTPPAISVPRRDPQVVALRGLLENVRKARDGEDTLPITLGQHIPHQAAGGRRAAAWLRVDLAQPETPHLLVAGTTGSGKTTVLKNALLSLAVAVPPTRLALVLIDPKPVNGFLPLASLPHLAAPVVTDERSALLLLLWVSQEMRRRVQAAASLDTEGGRVDYAAIVQPRILVAIDEISFLAESAGDENLRSIKAEVMRQIKGIAKAGRGVGIHLLLGTQRPSAEYLTSEMLANLPARAVGLVARPDDGRMATGMAGSDIMAHRLTGKGDFVLVLNSAKTFPFQAALIADNEDAKVARALRDEWWTDQKAPLRVDLPQLERQFGMSSGEGSSLLTPLAQQAAQQGSVPVTVLEPPDPAHVLAALETARRNEAAETPFRREQRWQFIVAAVQRHHAESGEWMSQNALARLHKATYGTALNSATARTLLQRAQATLPQAESGKRDRP